MIDTAHSAVLVITMSVVTILLRFLPFAIFRKKTPAYISYLGKVLPPAINAAPFGAPELIARILVAVLQVWKRKSLLSILAGTVVYMLLVQLVF